MDDAENINEKMFVGYDVEQREWALYHKMGQVIRAIAALRAYCPTQQAECGKRFAAIEAGVTTSSECFKRKFERLRFWASLIGVGAACLLIGAGLQEVPAIKLLIDKLL